MHIKHTLSRRDFVKGAGIAGTASVLGSPASLVGQTNSRGKARNLIFLVADGMGNGTVALAHYWSLRNRGRPLNWTNLYARKDIKHAMQETASASSPVTDSSAAASAWGIGHRINNRAVNVTPSGDAPPPLLLLAREAGKATGLVTTCRVTHATPAGFAANVPSRSQEDDIAVQYLDRGIDLLLGGGLKHFQRPDGEKPGVDLLRGVAGNRGYQVVRNRSELATAKAEGRLLGLFYDDHLPYAIDRQNNPSLSEVPDLETLFRKALKHLNRSTNGFALQVEAGRVDHAGHANDPATILHEMLEFDRCITMATEFQQRHPNTLVIITTDHGTGGCQLNGWGQDYNDSGPALERINRFKASFEGLQRGFDEWAGFDSLVFTQATGIASGPKEEAAIRDQISEGDLNLERAMIEVFAPELLETTAVGWTSHNHTGENVELFAFGPGSQDIPYLVPNYELFHVITGNMGLRV